MATPDALKSRCFCRCSCFYFGSYDCVCQKRHVDMLAVRYISNRCEVFDPRVEIYPRQVPGIMALVFLAKHVIFLLAYGHHFGRGTSKNVRPSSPQNDFPQNNWRNIEFQVRLFELKQKFKVYTGILRSLQT